MKTFALLIALCISFSSTSAQQSGWYQQHSGGTASILNVCFINRDTGWAGTFFTTNGGETWATYQDDRSVIQFIDSKHGWSHSKTIPGGVSRTTDGGQTWEDSPTGRDDLRMVVFYDTLNGFASFDYPEFSVTSDGGKRWHIGSSPISKISALVLYDSINRLIVGRQYTDQPPYEEIAGFCYSTNGGDDWTKFTHSQIHQIFQDAVAIDSVTVIVVGSKIMRSRNRGWEWKTINAQGGWEAISITDSNNNTIVGRNGKILRTNDAWKTSEFQNPNTPPDIDFYNVCFIDSATGWAVGELQTIIHTSDAGKTWVSQNLPKPLTTSVTPEPFSRKTSISYELPSAAKVKIRIYDILGKELEVLESPGVQDAGNHTIEFDGSRYPEGTFHYQIETDGFYGMGKMTKVVY